MEEQEHWLELARRDAKAIRGGIALACLAILVGVGGLFSFALIGGVAAVAGVFVTLNAVLAWQAGPRWMAERRLVLAPGVVAGIAVALGLYAVFGAAGAFVGSLPAAALATIVLGMTIAGHRR
ncbi:MAG: hypothetical protein QOK36_1735 [Gaiellales bacterium]|jgi:hypothetical protein|nr:hypothetical protein [Gaiellales bacterium]